MLPENVLLLNDRRCRDPRVVHNTGMFVNTTSIFTDPEQTIDRLMHGLDIATGKRLRDIVTQLVEIRTLIIFQHRFTNSETVTISVPSMVPGGQIPRAAEPKDRIPYTHPCSHLELTGQDSKYSPYRRPGPHARSKSKHNPPISGTVSNSFESVFANVRLFRNIVIFRKTRTKQLVNMEIINMAM